MIEIHRTDTLADALALAVALARTHFKRASIVINASVFVPRHGAWNIAATPMAAGFTVTITIDEEN